MSVDSIPDITGVFTHWNGICLLGILLLLWSGCFIETGSLMIFNIIARFSLKRGFPGSSADKESTCNAGDPSLIPGLGRWAGEGIDNPLQYFGASLVAQTVKNPPAVQETWVQCLRWEDPLEKGMATHSNILAWRIPWSEEPGMLQSMGSQRVGHNWATFTSLHSSYD